MKKYKKILSVILLLSIIFALFLPIMVHAEESYTLSGTWQFDENITASDSFVSEYINFSSYNCTSGIRIYYLPTAKQIRFVDAEHGNILVYENGDWYVDASRTVDFGSIPQTVSESFYLWFTSVANKVTVTSSNVLDDLCKDENFDVANYPSLTYDRFQALNTDNIESNDVEHISVIQLAEGVDKELFIYTYQPLENVSEINASSINMSIGFNSKRYEKYDLTLVSSNGVFKKYLVTGFTVSNDAERFYNISEIERPFNTLYDEKINGGTITNYKSHSVGQTWCCYYLNGNLVYEMEKLDVVEITPTLTGYGYLADGFRLSNLVGVDTGCYAHFIAFNVDNYIVDKIIDASITYKIIDTLYSETINYTLNIESSRLVTTSYKNKNGEWVTNPSSDDWTTVNFEISNEQTMNYQGGGLLAKKYSWDRILTAKDFVNSLESQDCVLGSDAKQTLNYSQFVFSFTEKAVTISDPKPEYSNDGIWKLTDSYFREGTEVAQVDILRLKFMSEGKTYNLGVVSDTTSSDDIPDFIGDELADPSDYLKDYLEDFFKILLFVIFITIFLIFVIFFKPVFKMLFVGVKEIFSLISSTITLPFQLIASAFKSKRR